MQTAKMRQYADISAEIKALEEKKSALAAVILEDLNEAGVKNHATKYGMFIKGVRTSFVYSETVKMLEIDLKAAKEKDIAAGNAEVKESEYLTFKPL